jgi:protein-S-isoprenylcysteine O-methyltransferase Ste14
MDEIFVGSLENVMNRRLYSLQDINPDTRREITRWIVQSFIGLVGYALLLFLAAGKLNWVWGWVLLGVLFLFLAAHPILLIPINPELLAERERGLLAEGVPAWDRWIAMLAAGLFPVISWVIAGLDVRFGWTGSLPLVVHALGLLGNLLGYGLFLWAMVSNAFFAEGVRIQEERGHRVATGGPYRYVRHPGYLGAIVALLVTPCLLGSLWAFVPASLAAVLYMVRTALEDRTLMAELPGYQDYAQQTRFRLLPWIW